MRLQAHNWFDTLTALLQEGNVFYLGGGDICTAPALCFSIFLTTAFIFSSSISKEGETNKEKPRKGKIGSLEGPSESHMQAAKPNAGLQFKELVCSRDKSFEDKPLVRVCDGFFPTLKGSAAP